MTKPQNSGAGLLSRRQAIGRVAGASLGIASALRAAEGADLAGAGLQTRIGSPPYPSWNTEMKQLAPNVYAYTQAGGPGVPRARVQAPLGSTGTWVRPREGSLGVARRVTGARMSASARTSAIA